MRYLQRKHFNELEGYCIYRCNKIIKEHTQVQIWYYRGQFKGYSYIIKVMRKTKPDNFGRVPYYEVYKVLKKARLDSTQRYHPKTDYTKGIQYSLYDCINYLSGMD